LGQIIVGDPIFIERRLTSRVNASKDLRKYLKNDELFIEYDDEIKVDNSILNIPLTATVLPLAWLTGSDLHVSKLDKTFKESMDKLQLVFKEIHPDIPFKTEIIADKLVDNRIKLDNTAQDVALLFSGGVDSTYSMIRNLEQKPRLIMLWGVDDFPYPENSEQWNHIYEVYKKRAYRLGLNINLVKTNISQIIYHKKINHNFHEMLHNGSVGALLQHSLPLLTPCAPLSFGRFRRLLIAASSGTSYNFEKYPWGSSPLTDETINWADLKVIHDGAIDRAEKITGLIKEFHSSNPLQLRVCLCKLDKAILNDSTCEKCLRTIAPLALAGIDPNTCGFNVDETSFNLLKEIIADGGLSPVLIDAHWIPIQKMIPKTLNHDFYGSMKFFEWFREYDMLSVSKKLDLHRKIYHYLPFLLADLLDRFYQKIGLYIHEASPLRESEPKKNGLE